MSLHNRWLFGGIAVAALVFLLGFLLIVSPARNSANDIAARAEDQNQQNVLTAAKIEQYKVQSSEVPAKRAEIQAVQKKLPPTLELPRMIREIESVANDAGLKLLSITPATPQVLGEEDRQSAGAVPTVSVPVAITALGSYTSIKSFVNGLEQMSRAYFVSGVDVNADGEDGGQLNLSLQGQVFSVPADSLALPKAAATPVPSSPAVPGATPNGNSPNPSAPAPNSGQAAAQLPKNSSKSTLAKTQREVTKTKKQQNRKAAVEKAMRK
jgi:Tfp pilus assembly protein PilO